MRSCAALQLEVLALRHQIHVIHVLERTERIVVFSFGAATGRLASVALVNPRDVTCTTLVAEVQVRSAWRRVASHTTGLTRPPKSCACLQDHDDE